jgi:hypothetical protein
MDIAKFRRFMALREERDTAKKVLKDAEAAYRAAEDEIFEILEDSPHVGTTKLDLGSPYGATSFLPRTTLYGRVIDDDAAAKYYRARGEGEEVVGAKFVMARVNEEVRGLKEQGQSMPPGVTYYEKRGVTVTTQKG